MNPHRGAVVRGTNERDATSGGAKRADERVDTVLGKPEPGPSDASGRASGRLPHERDEQLEGQHSGPRADIEQAARDIESGQLDTDLHNTPGVERVARERHPANQEDRDRQIANRSADDLADKRGQDGHPAHPRDEPKR